MFNSTLMDFDLGLLGESPFAAEHEKSLDQHLDEDKRMLDNNTSWLEATSDLQAFIDLGSLPEVEAKEEIDCQTVIDDVDKLLESYDATASDVSLEEVDIPAIEAFSQEEMAAAEDLLDELLKKTDIPPIEPIETKEEVKIEEEPKVESLNDSGFVDMTNVSKIITEDGQEILIVIAPPSPVPTTSVVAPESVAMIDSDDSEEWTPDSPRSSKGRPMVKRSPKRTNKKAAPYIKDKKERKKQQNVEAARRYRDKKKLEATDIETEEQELSERNKKLRSQVQELEAEVKTMKKLMLELNILRA